MSETNTDAVVEIATEFADTNGEGRSTAGIITAGVVVTVGVTAYLVYRRFRKSKRVVTVSLDHPSSGASESEEPSTDSA